MLNHWLDLDQRNTRIHDEDSKALQPDSDCSDVESGEAEWEKTMHWIPR